MFKVEWSIGQEAKKTWVGEVKRNDWSTIWQVWLSTEQNGEDLRNQPKYSGTLVKVLFSWVELSKLGNLRINRTKTTWLEWLGIDLNLANYDIKINNRVKV